MTCRHAAALAALGVALGACAPATVVVEEEAAAPATNQFALPPATQIDSTPLPGTDLPQDAADAAAVAGSADAAPNPRAFAGRWAASDGGTACSVVLTSGAPQADGSRLASASDCAGTLQGATGWRLGQSSIEIVGPGGVLATLGEGAPGTLTGGGVTLVR